MLMYLENDNIQSETDLNIKIAASFKAKTRGFTGADKIDCGLFFPEERGFHMLGVKQPIDVVIFKKDTIVSLYRNVRPTTGFGYHPFGTAMLELPAGSIEKYKINKKTKIFFKK